MSTPTSQPIADLLEKLGLGQYTQRFAENEITLSILPDLTDADLKELGISALGHRRLLLRAIAELHGIDKRTSAHPEPTKTAVGSEPRDAAERRQVTVMFSDLVGSTALSARMDPEDLREIISAYQKCVAETVQRFGGFVAKYMGDGVLVYFGYPQAHEYDAERAVRAGLQLIQTVGGLKSSAPLQTRVGIATGLVVVGDLIGSGEAQERGIVGETPNVAARLQGVAEPNTVVIAESTRKLVGNLFELEDRGPQELKGIDGTVRASVALRPSLVESRFEALRIATTPMVGRDEEMALLARRWEQVKVGEGRIVLVSGEPGIDKSRLAQTMVERLAGEPHVRLRFFCSPYHQDSALYPVIAHLERAAGFRRDDTAEQRLDKLEALLAQGTNDVSAVAPLLADLLAVPIGARYLPLNLTPEKRKEKTLAALTAQVEGLSAREPVLMVYEDVHWSDPTTRESLDLLIDHLSGRRILAIITFRPEFLPPWIGRPHVTMLTLNRLAPRQRAEMIAHVTGGKALPKEISNQIVERTDGVPLFIEELTKSVVESGLVTATGNSFAVTGPAAPLAIPTTLHASLLARLDRLAPTREVAQIGAALGRSFAHELISAVAQMPQTKLDDALEQLVSAELIFRRGTPPDAEYTFKHALVQDAAYSTLLRSRRQQLHGRIAATLEKEFPEIAALQPALMAQHCSEAGLNEQAIEYWYKAGQQAVARSAMTEAVAQLQKGLDQLASLPDKSRREALELNLQITLGPALIATRGYSSAQAGDTFTRASTLAQQLGRSDYDVALLYGLSTYHVVRSEYGLALPLVERMQQIGNERSDAATILQARWALAMINYHRGEFVTARDLYEQCVQEPAHRQTGSAVAAEDPYCTALGYLANTLAYLGYFDQAGSRANEGLVEARSLQHAHTLVGNLCCMCWVASLANSPHEVRRHAEEMFNLASEHGFAFWQAIATDWRGWASAAIGQADDGVELLTKAVSSIRAAGAVICTPMWLTHLAGAHGCAGHPFEGLSRLAEAGEIIEATDERHHQAEVYRLQGDLMNATGDQEAAERSYRRAIGAAERQNAKGLEVRAATSLARLWRDQDKRTEARDLLAPVYGWFTEGFDTPVLEEAKNLLDELPR
jgi:predicted ATPase/class 3 adenylate cyclase